MFPDKNNENPREKPGKTNQSQPAGPDFSFDDVYAARFSRAPSLEGNSPTIIINTRQEGVVVVLEQVMAQLKPEPTPFPRSDKPVRPAADLLPPLLLSSAAMAAVASAENRHCQISPRDTNSDAVFKAKGHPVANPVPVSAVLRGTPSVLLS